MNPPTIIGFIADKVHDLCNEHDIRDRIPSWITEGELAINKMLAETIFLKAHDMELDRENLSRNWAYRKAALALDKLPKSIAEIYRYSGINGLTSIQYISKQIALELAKHLKDKSSSIW